MAFFCAIYDFRFYGDIREDPIESDALAGENVAPTLESWAKLLRLRINLNTLVGFSTNLKLLSMEYSVNQSDWLTVTPGAAFEFADGKGQHGNQVADLLLSGATNKNEHIESVVASVIDTAQFEQHEFDICIKPTINAVPSTKYYFRFYWEEDNDGTIYSVAFGTVPSLTTPPALNIPALRRRRENE